jgi:peroxiredoxin
MSTISPAQRYASLRATISGLNWSQKVFLVGFEGGKAKVIDSASNNGIGVFQFYIPDTMPVGLYQLYLGKTIEAYQTSGPPQTLDLIWAGRDIDISSAFFSPLDSLRVIDQRDTENVKYLEYIKHKQVLNKKLDDLYHLLPYYTASDPFYRELVKQYNKEQTDEKAYEALVIKEYPKFFFTHLIRFLDFPFLDGALSSPARQAVIQARFFSRQSFADTLLLRSDIVEKRLISYIQSSLTNVRSASQEDSVLIAAVDRLLDTARSGDPVMYRYVINTLVNGFEQSKKESVLMHINEVYNSSTCENGLLSNDSKKRIASITSTAIGRQAPDIHAQDIHGENVNLSDIKTQYTIVLFWASWCEHCAEFVPALREALQPYIRSGMVTVIAVSLDNTKEDHLGFLAKADYSSWIHISDYKSWDGDIPLKYNVYGTPTVFILDSNKKIIGKPLTLHSLLPYFSQPVRE